MKNHHCARCHSQNPSLGFHKVKGIHKGKTHHVEFCGPCIVKRLKSELDAIVILSALYFQETRIMHNLPGREERRKVFDERMAKMLLNTSCVTIVGAGHVLYDFARVINTIQLGCDIPDRIPKLHIHQATGAQNAIYGMGTIIGQLNVLLLDHLPAIPDELTYNATQYVAQNVLSVVQDLRQIYVNMIKCQEKLTGDGDVIEFMRRTIDVYAPDAKPLRGCKRDDCTAGRKLCTNCTIIAFVNVVSATFAKHNIKDYCNNPTTYLENCVNELHAKQQNNKELQG